MAEIWRAEAIFEDGDSHPVAIKRVLPELANQPLFRSMFEDEARLGMLLRHPNIVRVYDARHVQGAYIMVMEYVDGVSLEAILERAHARRACMPVATGLHILRELARALAYAHLATDARGNHLGIVHRDVSPHNLLLDREGAVKLVDFGLANANVHETLQATDTVGGKLGYLAPELTMRSPGDHRIDIFAAGVVLWECLAGRRLFQGADDAETIRNIVRCEPTPLSQLNPKVPREVEDLTARILERDPDKRIASARVLLAEVENLLAALDPTVGPKDVSLLVGLHLAAASPRKTSSPPPGAALQQQLEAFAKAAANTFFDVGATPLDPADFAGSVPIKPKKPPR